MNIFQITAIYIFTQNGKARAISNERSGSDDIEVMLNLMLTVGCSDPNLTHNLKNIKISLEFMNQWLIILIIFALFNVFIDFGVRFTFGNTYSTFFRRCKRCICCKSVRKSIRKKIGRSKDDNGYKPVDGANDDYEDEDD